MTRRSGDLPKEGDKRLTENFHAIIKPHQILRLAAGLGRGLRLEERGTGLGLEECGTGLRLEEHGAGLRLEERGVGLGLEERGTGLAYELEERGRWTTIQKT